MRVFQAQKAGFCLGVKRAIKLAEQEGAHGPVYSWGPLIHNNQVVEKLRDRGIQVATSLEDLEPGQKLIIRSHGVSPLIYEESQKRGIEIIDATCPLVRKAQLQASQASCDSVVIIVGDSHHPEVQGILGWAGKNTLVVKTLSQARELGWYSRLSVIAQTTLTRTRFTEIINELNSHTDQLTVYDTICPATEERQKAADALAEKVDVMVVVGGPNSANTRELAGICQRKAPTYLIETADELQGIWFRDCRTAGLTAGASTPDWIIEEVYEKMSEEWNKVEATVGTEESIASETENAGENIVGEEVTAAEEVKPEDTLAADSAGPSLGDAAETESVDEAATGAVVEALVGAGANQEDAAADEDFSDTMEGFEGSLPKLYKGAVVTGTVVKISSDEVFVDISWKSEGIIPANELSSTKVTNLEDVVNLGDTLSAVVLRIENEEGHPILSRRRANEIQARERLARALETKEEIRARVMEAVKGGLLVDLGMRGFVPASQIQPGFVEDLSVFVGQELRLRVLEYDDSKKKLILSQKVILNEEMESKRAQLLQTLQVGDIVDGIVRRLTKFGAFVDIGGVDGLLHISDMAFSRLKHPSEMVSINEQIRVQILSVDPKNNKISLGLKQLKINPWDNVGTAYAIGSVVNGTVVRIATFGAFVQLEDGIDALVHISQLAPRRVPKVEDVVKVGEVITAKVIECKPEEKRISLSIREYLTDQQNKEGLESYEGDAIKEEPEKSETTEIGEIAGLGNWAPPELDKSNITENTEAAEVTNTIKTEEIVSEEAGEDKTEATSAEDDAAPISGEDAETDKI